MAIFFVRRRCVARGAHDLDAAFARLRRLEDRAGDCSARWWHSFAVREVDGSFGLACVFEAPGMAAVLQHARAAALAADEIVPVLAVRIERDDRPFTPAPAFLVRQASDRATPDGAAMRCLRRYDVCEPDAATGSRCLYEGTDADALGAALRRAGSRPVEIVPVIGRVAFRDERALVDRLPAARASA